MILLFYINHNYFIYLYKIIIYTSQMIDLNFFYEKGEKEYLAKEIKFYFIV